MNKIVSLLVFCCLVWCLASGGAVAQIAGDANGDGVVNLGDVVYEISYLYKWTASGFL